MRTTFLVRQALWRRCAHALLASLVAGCGAMPADAGKVAGQAGESAATAANGTKDEDASVDRGVPVLNLAHEVGKAALEIRFPSEKAQILPLKTDANVNPGSGIATVELVASVWSNTLVVQDTYASMPGPLSMCQAGQESFLRVIGLAPLKEILSFKLASCRDDIELASPGLEWDAHTATLKIRWLSDVNHIAQEKTLRIARDGTIVPSLQ